MGREDSLGSKPQKVKVQIRVRDGDKRDPVHFGLASFSYPGLVCVYRLPQGWTGWVLSLRAWLA